jgi:crotonobetainyl-CoA:carnitine CoA-transferase CaiB-like acyl-CoA transferase
MQALQGLKVIELGQLIAGPFAGKTLADFGADVIKVEPPEVGDPLRKWRMLRDGTSVWWEVQSRNKRSVCLDLRTTQGQQAVRDLATEADVLIENFKPGTLEAWGLGWEQLHALNPRLIMLRISGYGQTGPYRDKPGFGVLGESMGGLRYLTGEPGRVPVRVGVSLGDSLAALHGVIGVLTALRSRGPHLFGGRHRGEPSVPRPRDAARHHYFGRPAPHGTGCGAQAQRNPGSHPQGGPVPRRTHRRPQTPRVARTHLIESRTYA